MSDFIVNFAQKNPFLSYETETTLTDDRSYKDEEASNEELCRMDEEMDTSTTSSFGLITSSWRQKLSNYRAKQAREMPQSREEDSFALALNLQHVQVELLQTVQHITKNISDMKQDMKNNHDDVCKRLERLEGYITKLETSKKERRKIRKESDDEAVPKGKKKKKKRNRKAIRTSTAVENYVPKSIPKSEKVKESIKTALQSDIHFQTCSDEEMQDILGAFHSLHVSCGEKVVKQDEIMKKLFFIEEGKIDALIDGEPAMCLRKNSIFGEFSLLFDCASPSSFEAISESKLWFIACEDYRIITSYYRKKRMQLKKDLIKEVKFGSQKLGQLLNMDELNTLALALKAESFYTQQIIFEEGDKGSKFFMIEEGEVKLEGFEASCTLKQGNYFGEEIFMEESESMRCSTCTALSNVKCLVLCRDDFTRMIGSVGDILDRSFKQRAVGPKKESLRDLHDDKLDGTVKYDIQLSDLIIKQILGQGTFSTVKLVQINKLCGEKYQELNNLKFALKCSKKDMLHQNDFAHHLQIEQAILSELNHPFIEKYYSKFEDSTHIYTLLEAVIGVDLYKVLNEEHQFSEDMTRFYTASVLLAFSEIHSKYIAFRDLKPENLIIDYTTGYVKMVGFSFATIVTDKTWTLCGTPDYFAPEIVKNEGHDWAVDYWALGVLLYEFTVGTPPFASDNEVEVYQKILRGYIEFPPQMNQSLKYLIERLCTADQSKRLGRTNGGFDTVKEQLWFSGFDWEALFLKKMRAPHVVRAQKGGQSQLSSFTPQFRASKTSQNNLSISASTNSISCLRSKSKANDSLTNLREKSSLASRPSAVKFSNVIQTTDGNGTVSESLLDLTSINIPMNGGFDDDTDSSVGLFLDETDMIPTHTSTRYPRKGYVFGKNRYQQTLHDFLNTKHNSSGTTLHKSMSSVNVMSSSLNLHSSQNLKSSINLMSLNLFDSTGCIDESLKGSFLQDSSFDEFFLFSISPESFDKVSSPGSQYNEPFSLKFPDLLDQYTYDEQTKTHMTANDIAQTCFPSGVKIRFIPRCALHTAEKLGVIGPKSDKYMLHTFTNISGLPTYGVSVTIREVMLNSNCKILKLKRERRRAALTIQKKWRICREHMSHSSLSYRETSSSSRTFKFNETLKESFKFSGDSFKDSFKFNSESFNFQSEVAPPSKPSRNASFKRAGNFFRRFSMEAQVYEQGEFEDVLRGLNPSNDPPVTSMNHREIPSSSKARESYDTMKENEKMGDVCIIEKCYVFIGISPDQQSLLLCALQQLVELERRACKSSRHPTLSLDYQSNSKKEMFGVLDRSSDYEAIKQRHISLKRIQNKFILSPEEAKVTYPKNEYKHLKRNLAFVNIDPLDEKFRKISLPLPLPQISGEFGVATLLLKLKSNNLLSLLNLLLIERSILILGTNPAEVTSCTCALLELIKPFQWASAFMPIIPNDMLDFVSSPVPFIAGACADTDVGLQKIQGDFRVVDALGEGLSILNLNSRDLIVTTEEGIKNIVSNSHGVIHQRLNCYESRLDLLTKKDSTALLSFTSFFQQGASSQESLTISSLKQEIYNYINGLFKSFSEDPEEWRNYGELDNETKAFKYYPDMLVSPLQSQFYLQEIMAHTQLFVGFVEQNKDRYLNLGRAATFIADWISFNWAKRHKNVCKESHLLQIG